MLSSLSLGTTMEHARLQDTHANTSMHANHTLQLRSNISIRDSDATRRCSCCLLR